MDKSTSPLVIQTFVVSAVMSTILSCGLALGYLTFLLDKNAIKGSKYSHETSHEFIVSCGDTAFLLSIVIIPFIMQKKGRRTAYLINALLILLAWLTSFDVQHLLSLIIFNVLYNISLGGTVTISSIIISEFCSPTYRGAFLILETVMISIGLLLSHLSEIYSCWRLVSILGTATAALSLIVTYYWPESPYWLINKGNMSKGISNFHLLRGHDQKETRELETLIMVHEIKFQSQASRTARKCSLRENVLYYLKSLLKSDFLKPLSIMILLFSFIGLGGENFPNYSIRNVLMPTNEKLITTIILDVVTLICAIVACILTQMVRRKTLFIYTSSFSVLFMAMTSFTIFLQTFDYLSKDYLWLSVVMFTGLVMFMSLGTTALPLSLLGEIFPMSSKGVGSSLLCAYFWIFSNSVLKLTPVLTERIGLHGTMIICVMLMSVILMVLKTILPETNTKTLVEIEQIIKDNNEDPELIANSDREDDTMFDKLQLFIDII